MIFLSLSLKTKYKLYIFRSISVINSPQYSHYPSKIMFQSKGMCVQKVTTERKNESIHERMRGGERESWMHDPCSC
jgi:hypothetical protein